MAFCKTCGAEMDWGHVGDRWIPLEPIELHGDLDRRYRDENGVLRADHRDRHEGFSGVPVELERLPKKIPAARAAAMDPKPAPSNKSSWRGWLRKGVPA